MAKIIKFINQCSKCKFYENNGACKNQRYLKALCEIIAVGECPYFKKNEKVKSKFL